MTSKERVHAALRRDPVDRVPVWMWFHPETARRLGDLLEIPAGQVGRAMGDDVVQAWVGNNYAMEGIVHESDGQGHADLWGVNWVKSGHFNQIDSFPLLDVSRDEILRYRHPHDHMDELLAGMDAITSLGDHMFVGCDVSPCLFELVCRLRGMEQAALDLAADPELAWIMLGQAERFTAAVTGAACSRFALDWLWTGDDVGGQQAMIMSPACWRQAIKPRLARIVAIAKAGAAWVAYHSCGAIRQIIPDLIESGVDVLNPVQCNCPGMEPLALKQEFGADLAFMGGVDTQGLLPYGTVSEVHVAIERLIEGMTAGGGGYILAASHTVPPETPVGNIFAVYDAAGITREEILDRAADIRTRRDSA